MTARTMFATHDTYVPPDTWERVAKLLARTVAKSCLSGYVAEELEATMEDSLDTTESSDAALARVLVHRESRD